MPIPRVIYQTWKTKNLPIEVQNVRAKIIEKNPTYEMVLYDDNDIEEFIKNNFDSRIFNAYKQLAVGAAKADLWRYLILYKNGGVYLDIDSDITGNLDNIVSFFDECIITRENNPGLFTQWILLSDAGHPIFKYTIDMCIENIEKRSTTNIAELTGPNVYSAAVNKYITETVGISNVYFCDDKMINNRIEMSMIFPSCKFFSYDLSPYAKYKHDSADKLYSAVNHIYWRDEKKVFND